MLNNQRYFAREAQPFSSANMRGRADSFSRGTSIHDARFRSRSRNSNPNDHNRLGDRFTSNFMPNGHSDLYQSNHQTWGDQDSEDLEYCRPRGSTIGDFEQDNFQYRPRRSSVPGNQMYGYADPYAMSSLSASPREHMMRAQMMRGGMYGMDPMMGRMSLNGGYGSIYGGGMGYGMVPSMLGTGVGYGYGPRPMLGMGSMVGSGYPVGGIRPYGMSGLVDNHGPHLMRAKTWSAYGRLM